MLHSHCRTAKKNAQCIEHDKCTEHLPNKFNEETMINEDSLPMYKRRDIGLTITRKEVPLDNRSVVPYNRNLLVRFNAHINVEYCNHSWYVQYLFKYVNQDQI